MHASAITAAATVVATEERECSDREIQFDRQGETPVWIMAFI